MALIVAGNGAHEVVRQAVGGPEFLKVIPVKTADSPTLGSEPHISPAVLHGCKHL